MITLREAIDYIKIHKDVIAEKANKGDSVCENIISLYSMICKGACPGSIGLLTEAVEEYQNRPKAITEERLIEIMENDSDGSWTGDNTLQGLNIIAKYFNKDKEILEGADHDVIYSVSVDDIIDAGITEEDVKKLSKLNWMIENDYLACYV